MKFITLTLPSGEKWHVRREAIVAVRLSGESPKHHPGYVSHIILHGSNIQYYVQETPEQILQMLGDPLL